MVHFTTFKKKLKWSDIRPSTCMVTHTPNSCSAFNPSKVHTHTAVNTHTVNTHTVNTHPGQTFMLRRPGSSRGFGALLKGTSSWYWGWRERCTFTPPTYNSCRPKTHNLWITSPTLQPLGHDFPRTVYNDDEDPQSQVIRDTSRPSVMAAYWFPVLKCLWLLVPYHYPQFKLGPVRSMDRPCGIVVVKRSRRWLWNFVFREGCHPRLDQKTHQRALVPLWMISSRIG